MLEQLLPLKLPPGLYRNGTRYQAKGRWYDANLVRFYEGAVRPVQGWRVAFDNNGDPIVPLQGVPRAALGWRSALGSALLAVGTTEKLYVIKDGVTYDITPVDFTGGQTNAGSGGNGDYGDGLYGRGLYGVGKAPLAATLTDADTWQLDAFGDVLVACSTSGGRIYVWTGDVDAVAEVAGGSSPEPNRGVVITPERFIVALGANDDVRLATWAAQATLDDWTPTDENTAGDFTLSTNGRIMCGRRTKAQTLIWTDADMHSMNYIGGTFIYSFKQEGDNCGIIGPQAVAMVDTAAIWMGRDNFFAYDGFVKPVPCEVHDHVFGDFNSQQASKVFACPVSEFSEIWWFYPSAGSAENDRYVVYNYRENHWTVGLLGRTAAIDRGAMPSPVMFDANGAIYQHEQGAGTRLVPLPTIISDTTLDLDEVDLQDHTPGGSPLAFTWAKVSGDDLTFDTNILRRDGSTEPIYVADVELGTADYSITGSVRQGAAPFATDDFAGLGARMAGGESKAGYYFGVRTDTPTLELRGYDAAGAAIFTALSADVPESLEGADLVLTLQVVGNAIKGYAGGLLMLEKTDATYASGKAGRIGSWPSAGSPSGYADSFTDTNGTHLEDHTPDGSSEFTWTQNGTGSPVHLLIEDGFVYGEGTSPANSRHTSSDVDTSDDSDFTATILVKIATSPNTSAAAEVGLLSDASAVDGYNAGVGANSSTTFTLTLTKFVGQAQHDLGAGASTGAVARPAPGLYALVIRKSGSALTATFAGHTVTATDSTYTTVNRASIGQRTNSTRDFAIDAFGAGGSTPSPLLGHLGLFSVKGLATATQEVLEDAGAASFDSDGNMALVPFLESGPVELGDGDQVMRVQRIVPDEKNLGDVRARFFSALMPTDAETELGPYSLSAPTPVRFTARQVRLRVEEVEAVDWRLGTTRLGVIPGGRR